ncbi:hypothetical protein EBX31_03860, partial [bacterium]|nr:hypothetical protein [bacterium]
MRFNSYAAAGGILLLLLIVFMLEPSIWMKKFGENGEGTGEESVASGLRNPSAPPVEEKKKNSRPSGTKDFDGTLETGSGREMPGEKVLLFQDAAAYRRFLGSAPGGVVLGQIEGLRAVRVRDGEWLKSMGSGQDRTRGEAAYRVVGAKALDLLGAEGVTSDWGKNVKVALLDTSVDEAETVLGAEAGHGTSMKSLVVGGSGAVQGAAPAAQINNIPVLDGEGKGNSFTLAQAIVQAVDTGAQVINMSLGSDGDSAVVRAAVTYALSKNVALVAAAGNEAV